MAGGVRDGQGRQGGIGFERKCRSAGRWLRAYPDIAVRNKCHTRVMNARIHTVVAPSPSTESVRSHRTRPGVADCSSRSDAAAAAAAALRTRLDAQDWPDVLASLDARGWARLPRLLDAAECAALVARYDDAAQFRSRVVMARHGFGQGEYRYFAYPLPPDVDVLRDLAYGRLVELANRWQAALGSDQHFPARHGDLLRQCRSQGQVRPTPLLLRYRPGDYNCLHQDLYGEVVFPLQFTILLSAPGVDFEGGEFVLTEQRPRRQSRVQVVPLARGDAVIFAASVRPVAGSRGWYRVNQRHGVSEVTRGCRHALGVIFHDAR